MRTSTVSSIHRHFLGRSKTHTSPLRIPHTHTVQTTSPARRNTNNSPNPLRRQVGQTQTLHTTHTAPYTRIEFVDPQVIHKRDLGTRHIVYTEQRESSRPSCLTVSRRVRRARARAAETPAEDIGANNEKFVGIDTLARPDKVLPPSRLGGSGRRDVITS